MISYEYIDDNEEVFKAVIASKCDCSSLDDFVNQAVLYLDSRDIIGMLENSKDYIDNYKNDDRIYTPIELEPGKSPLEIHPDNPFVSLGNRIGPDDRQFPYFVLTMDHLTRAFYIGQPEALNYTIVIETKTDYIYYSWACYG